MKTLTLLRHAKAAVDDPVARDFDRTLNQRGRLACRAIGKAMRSEGLMFDSVIASPAVRVTETVSGVVDGYGRELRPDYDLRIYLASVSALLEIVQHADDASERLLIVGHNPGLENLALVLTHDDGNGLRGEIAIKYPTAALTEIHLPVERWSEVGEGAGTIVRFIRPRDLDPALGPDADSY
jgi:phosphohistidine phosphatase